MSFSVSVSVCLFFPCPYSGKLPKNNEDQELVGPSQLADVRGIPISEAQHGGMSHHLGELQRIL